VFKMLVLKKIKSDFELYTKYINYCFGITFFGGPDGLRISVVKFDIKRFYNFNVKILIVSVKKFFHRKLDYFRAIFHFISDTLEDHAPFLSCHFYVYFTRYRTGMSTIWTN